MSWASNCWNTCASTIPSARFRFTASAESGERFRWVCLPAVNYGSTGPFARRQFRAARRACSTAVGLQVLMAQCIGSAIITRLDLRCRHGSDVCGERDGPAAHFEGRRAARSRSARARHLRLSGIRDFGDGQAGWNARRAGGSVFRDRATPACRLRAQNQLEDFETVDSKRFTVSSLKEEDKREKNRSLYPALQVGRR